MSLAGVIAGVLQAGGGARERLAEVVDQHGLAVDLDAVLRVGLHLRQSKLVSSALLCEAPQVADQVGRAHRAAVFVRDRRRHAALAVAAHDEALEGGLVLTGMRAHLNEIV